MMKTLIQQLQDGEIAIKNDGTVEDPRRVLKVAFPKDYFNCGGNYDKYSASSDNRKWTDTPENNKNKIGISTLEFIKELDNQTNMKTITAKRAQSIIDISCTSWQDTLAVKWARHIVLGKNIEISEEFYQEMRKACTDEQNVLFDKVFGKDELTCHFKEGEMIYIGVKPKWWNGKTGGKCPVTCTKITFPFIGKLEKILLTDGHLSLKIGDYSFAYLYDKTDNKYIRKATPEEIKKAQCYPDGTACLVRDNTYDGWDFRYADGNGKFYIRGSKSGLTNEWKQHMKLDMNNLPVN
tara:strand:- start:670 stop:1551 length:882 start_codon:yes stop_codon:yes gene_type:complete